MIHIIIAVYNGETYLSEQLDSILANTNQNWHATIYDDGSVDATADICLDYRKRYPNKFAYVRNKNNLGVTRNFLTALKNNTDEYVMFCDQDDYWLPGKIELAIKKMKELEAQERDRPLTVFSDARPVDAKRTPLSNSFHASNHLDAKKTDLSHLLIENKLIGCTMLMNRKVGEMIKKLPKNAKMHDWWVGLICTCFGEIAYIEQCTLLYRQHDKNVVGSDRFYSYVIKRIKNLKKQKEALVLLEKQGDEFYQMYKKQLKKEQRRLIYQFAHLNQYNWLKRRIILIKNNFYKTGFIRNVGVFFLV